MTKKRLIFFFIIVCLFVIARIKWSQSDTNVENASENRQVSATIFPLYDIVKQIAGDNIEVDLILAPGASPHTFEPSPQIIKTTQNARIVFAIGYGLDDWAVNLVVSQERIHLVSEGIVLRQSMQTQEENNPDGPIDPHYWLDVKNAMRMAETISRDLIAEFPDEKEHIEVNLASYLSQLEKLDQDIRSRLTGLERKSLITFHDAWYYFADAYGLTIAGTFEPTVGREPTPKYLSNLSRLIRETGVKVVYTEPQFSSANLKAFLSDQNVILATIDPEGSTEHASYIDLMYANANTIAKNQ